MDIRRIDPLFPSPRPSIDPAPAESAPSRSDRVEISPADRMRQELAKTPDIRLDKVAALRRAIESGTYETPDKLWSSAIRIWDDLR